MVGRTIFFVLSERAERTGEPIGFVLSTIESCKRRASKFQRVLPSLESEDGLHAIFFIAKNYNDARLAGGRLFIALQGFLTSFQLACDSALKEIREFPALKEGDAWKSWIRSLNQITKDNGLPFEVRKDAGNKSKSDKPSPFTVLVKVAIVSPRRMHAPHAFGWCAGNCALGSLNSRPPLNKTRHST